MRRYSRDTTYLVAVVNDRVNESVVLVGVVSFLVVVVLVVVVRRIGARE